MIYRVDFAPMYPDRSIGDRVEGYDQPTLLEAMASTAVRVRDANFPAVDGQEADAVDLTLSWAEDCEGCSDCDLPGVRWPSETNEDNTRFWIERCDTCMRYESDIAAADALVEAKLIDGYDLARPAGSQSYTPFQIWTRDPRLEYPESEET